MVLGLISGSMPMLVSLLLMQGITLTMWRSFLDRTIPKLEPGGDRLRKSLENLFIAQQANMATPSTTPPPTPPPPSSASLSSSLQSSPPGSSDGDDYHPPPNSLSPPMSLPSDPVSLTKTLEILSKIDPSVLKLFTQLTTQQQPTASSQPSPPASVAKHGPSSVAAPLSADQPVQYLEHPHHLHQQHDQLYNPLAGYAPTEHDHHHDHPHHHYSYPTGSEEMSSAPEESPYETPGQQLQYVHYPTSPQTSQDGPNVKYIEVSSGNANYDQEHTMPEGGGTYHGQQYDQQVQYVYQPQAPGDAQYEYVQQEPQSQQQSPQEIVEQEPEAAEPQQPEMEEMSSEEHKDKTTGEQTEPETNEEEARLPNKAEEDVAEDSIRPTKVRKPKTKDKRPPVIIGAPIIKSKRVKSKYYPKLSRKRKLKRLQRERYLRYLRLRAHKSRMFGKPHQRRKRMLFFRDFYSKKKKEQEVEQRTSTFSFKRKRKRKKLKQHRQEEQQPRPPPPKQRTSSHHPGFGGSYRFATPTYPMIMLGNVTFPEARSSFPPPSMYHSRALNRQHDLHFAENQVYNIRANETARRTTIDMGKVNKTATIKLKSKKIKLFDLHSSSTGNCTIPESNKAGQMKTLWTSKNGQINSTSKCIEPIKFIPGNNIELNLAPKSVMPTKKTAGNDNKATKVVSTLANETSPEMLSTTTPIIENGTNVETNIRESVQRERETTTTLRPETTTTTPSATIDPMSKFDPNAFFLGLNNFLKNYATSTPQTITTTKPSEGENLATSKFAEQLPKEFMLHILKAMNMSKIDNFQVGNRPAMRNKLKAETEREEDEGDDDEDNADDEEEDEDINLPAKDVDNVVDGVMPVGHRFKRVCYYLLDGGKDGQLDIALLELHICSHLIVGYARVSTTGLVIVEKPLEDTEKYRRLTQMKSANPNLKVLLSIGDLGGTSFSIVASSNRTRDRFVSSVLDFCDEFNFDGVDIDWEFPSFRTGYREDKQNFVILLNNLRAKSNRLWPKMRARRGGGLRRSSHFIISVAVGAPLVIASTSYMIPAIGKVVDFVNLMSYDFHHFRTDRPYTGHHSPLYPRNNENAYYATLNVAWAATYWANNGMPLKKIIVGVPTYARTFNLVVPIGQYMFNVPAVGPGLGRGKLNYTAVCDFLKAPDTHKEFEIYTQVPYAYRGFDWVAYENEISVAIKAEWVIKTGMGGVVTFALNFDDARGTCREDGKRFPLQKTISNLLELASIKSYKESAYVMKIRGAQM